MRNPRLLVGAPDRGEDQPRQRDPFGGGDQLAALFDLLLRAGAAERRRDPVDGLHPVHRDRQRLWIEQIAAHRLGADRRQPLRPARARVARQGADPMAGREQRTRDRGAVRPGRAGDKNRIYVHVRVVWGAASAASVRASQAGAAGVSLGLVWWATSDSWCSASRLASISRSRARLANSTSIT